MKKGRLVVMYYPEDQDEGSRLLLEMKNVPEFEADNLQNQSRTRFPHGTKLKLIVEESK